MAIPCHYCAEEFDLFDIFRQRACSTCEMEPQRDEDGDIIVVTKDVGESITREQREGWWWPIGLGATAGTFGLVLFPVGANLVPLFLMQGFVLKHVNKKYTRYFTPCAFGCA